MRYSDKLTKSEAMELLRKLVEDTIHDAFLPTSGDATIESILNDLAYNCNNYVL